jgi:hypothetical protein
MLGPIGTATKELLDELTSRGITVQVKEDSLNVSPRICLTDSDRVMIQKLKKPIISYLSPCEPHINSSAWDREPLDDRPGWEKATCRRCGRFIGSNPIRRTSIHGKALDITETGRAPP